MMNKISYLLLTLTGIIVVSCAPGKGVDEFAGIYDDEFNNHFELYDDQTAVILFAGETDRIVTKWAKRSEDGKTFATIEYNGDPAYYYLYNGALYRSKENMNNSSCAIELK